MKNEELKMKNEETSPANQLGFFILHSSFFISKK